MNTAAKTERDAALVPDWFPVPNSYDSQAWLNFLSLGFVNSLYYLVINF